MNSNESSLTGKESAKINQRKRFYSKFERYLMSLEQKDDQEQLIPLMFNKKGSFPEYDDLTLIFNDFSDVIKDIDPETKEEPVSLTDLDEGYFLKNMSKGGLIKIFREETLENDDGTIRKGSTGSIDDYNYQKAYNFYIKILKSKEFIETVEKEKDNPTTYNIPVKTKKIEKKNYIKTYRYPRKRKR